jgi:hypothetical protein
VHHGEDCEECDGSGFIQVWDTDDCADEDNCRCRNAKTVADLCDECKKVQP